MNRRLLLNATALASTTLLVACAGQTGVPVTTQVANALTVGQAIDQALIKILADASTLFPNAVTPAQATVATGWLTTAAQGLTALLGATAPPAGASTLTIIDTYVNDALKIAGPVLAVTVPGAAPIIAAIEAVDALLPVFEAIVTPLPPVAAARMAKRLTARAAMTPDQGLEVLSKYLARK